MVTNKVRTWAALGAALGAALVSVSACESRVVADEPVAAYSLSEVSYGIGGRDAPVIVQGNPFGLERARFETTVTDAMQGHVMGVSTHFTTTPGDSARRDYRVVMVFNPARPVVSATLCAGPVATTPPAGEEMVVVAAFCRGGGALTAATGYLTLPADPDGPVFRRLIGDLTFALFPPPHRDSGMDGPCLFGC